jgi:hypothetical protein
MVPHHVADRDYTSEATVRLDRKVTGFVPIHRLHQAIYAGVLGAAVNVFPHHVLEILTQSARSAPCDYGDDVSFGEDSFDGVLLVNDNDCANVIVVKKAARLRHCSLWWSSNDPAPFLLKNSLH